MAISKDNTGSNSGGDASGGEWVEWFITDASGYLSTVYVYMMKGKEPTPPQPPYSYSGGIMIGNLEV